MLPFVLAVNAWHVTQDGNVPLQEPLDRHVNISTPFSVDPVLHVNCALVAVPFVVKAKALPVDADIDGHILQDGCVPFHPVPSFAHVLFSTPLRV